MSKLPEKTNGLLLQIFRKATSIGVFTNYDSLIFDTYKIRISPLAFVLLLQNLFQFVKFSYRSKTPEKYFQI